jgi:hypothetical protein
MLAHLSMSSKRGHSRKPWRNCHLGNQTYERNVFGLLDQPPFEAERRIAVWALRARAGGGAESEGRYDVGFDAFEDREVQLEVGETPVRPTAFRVLSPWPSAIVPGSSVANGAPHRALIGKRIRTESSQPAVLPSVRCGFRISRFRCRLAACCRSKVQYRHWLKDLNGPA